ncbi:MAG: hypothetical protein JNJ69_00730 [Leptospiraceae bacterium]|nr:hypothetical protein [Leptospiraceae bacterium]
MVLILVIFSSHCLGRATPPEQVKLTQQQNEVLGKFARQVGEQEINILLKDPNDPTLPGLPVGDLLYILSKVNEDKLIRLVKGISATTTLELILAIKRVGCTRANNVPVVAQYTFNATVPLNTPNDGLNYCKWNHFHLPNIMVQLLNGANSNGLQTLIDTVNHSYTTLNCASNASGFLDANQALCPSTTSGAINSGNNLPYDATVSHYSFLMKLAYVVVGFDTPTAGDPNLSSDPLIGPPKLYNLMNLTLDGRDMVFLLNSFDQNACPGVASTTSNCVYVDVANVLTTYAAAGDLWADIAANNQFQGLQNLTSIMAQVTDTSKMGTLVNGYRTARFNTGQDDAQIRYYIDRLKVVLEHSAPIACTAATFPGTAAEQALQYYVNPNGGNAVWNTKLATLINLITNVNRMMDLVYYIEDGYDINHNSVYSCPNRGLDNLLVMLNNLNSVAAHNAPNTTNNELITAAYLIDNVALVPLAANPAKRNKVKYLVEYMGNTLDVLQLACYTAVADQVDGVTPADATPETCDNRGLINLAADGSKLNDAAVTDLTAAGQKLTNLTGQITEIEDMRFLVRKVSMSNMTQIIAGLQIASTVNVANLVNQINGADCWGENFGVVSTTITGAGAGYTSPPTVSFVGGAGATGKAVIETDAVNFAATVGQVKDVIILNAGNGYAAPPAAVTINFAGGGGAGATATARSGSCRYNAGTNEYRGFPSSAVAGATGATGLGKMVNVINHIVGSPTTVVTLINGVTDGQKLGLLINGIGRSSNLVGVMNATVDATRNNNATITDLISLLNTTPRVDVYKLVHMMDSLGDASEMDTVLTIPAGDHDMVAQLIAPYSRTGNVVNTNSGVGSAQMANLIASLSMHGGGGFTDGSLIALGGGVQGRLNVAVVNGITGTNITGAGSGCSGVPTVTVGGGGSSAVIVPYMSGGQVIRLNILNSGTGYTTNPIPLTFAGGGCTVAPTGEAYSNGVGTITVLNSGTPATYNTSFQFAIAGAYPGTATAAVTGAINTTPALGLSSVIGGTGYTNGDVCPLVGAGGSGALCTVTAAGGAVTGCSALTGGANYASGRIVKIGGRAAAVAYVSGGNIAVGLGSAAGGLKIVQSGCGYAGAPSIQVVGCTTEPTAVAVMTGSRVTDINVTAAGTGCSSGAKVIIGDVKATARVTATVAAGSVTGYTVVNGGAGYGASASVTVMGCTTAPTANATVVGGVVTAVNVVTGGSGCTGALAVYLNGATYAAHGDGASALVNQVTGGIVTSMSVSDASVNAAQLVQLVDRDSTGQGIAINLSTADLNAGGISAREALVRLLHHGVTPVATSSMAWYNASLGVGGPADMGNDGLANGNQVAGVYVLDWPGLGTQHIAGAILNNVGSASTQTLVNLVNSNVTTFTDMSVVMGCGDRSTYSNGWTTFGWQQLCTESGPGVW